MGQNQNATVNRTGLHNLRTNLQQRQSKPYNRVNQERMLGAKKFAWNVVLNNFLFPCGTNAEDEMEYFSIQDFAAASKAERAALLDAFSRQIPDRAQGEESQIMERSDHYVLLWRDAEGHLETISMVLDNPISKETLAM